MLDFVVLAAGGLLFVGIFLGLGLWLGFVILPELITLFYSWLWIAFQPDLAAPTWKKALYYIFVYGGFHLLFLIVLMFLFIYLDHCLSKKKYDELGIPLKKEAR